MGDIPGDLELIPEAVDRVLVGRHLGLDELQGHLGLDFLVVDFVDLAHSAFAKLFDDLVAIGKRRTRAEFFKGSLKCLRLKQGEFLGRL